uniref:Uncharacterized protein n=1 Tax=Timema douglasi TaxID=61478 RepID=A0A7R8VQL9_TIMDO|nr:unnamed protein product [Timema douglasi]
MLTKMMNILESRGTRTPNPSLVSCRRVVPPVRYLRVSPALSDNHWGRAQQLYNADFKTLKDIANTDVNTLVSCVDHMSRKVAGQIIAAARLLLLEKVESLREEAQEVLEGISVIAE